MPPSVAIAVLAQAGQPTVRPGGIAQRRRIWWYGKFGSALQRSSYRSMAASTSP